MNLIPVQISASQLLKIGNCIIILDFSLSYELW